MSLEEQSMGITFDEIDGVLETLDLDTVQERWRLEENGWVLIKARLGGSCKYADPRDLSVPSCIVGHIIHALDPERFAEIAEECCSAATACPDGTPANVANWLRAVQHDADMGDTWREAIARRPR
jgi:hypothetical protein